MGLRIPIIALLSTLTAGLCAEPIRVSTFSTVLTEIAEQIGADRVSVHAHIKPGIDPHEFEPKPADLKVVSESQVILLSAKHMEGYVGKLKEATGTSGNVVEVGNQFPSLRMQPDQQGHDHGKPGDSGTVEDPHWWHSVGYTKRAVKVVRDALIKASPADKEVFTRNADAYLAKLDSLQKWVATKLAELPRNKRKLVTSHDAFQYFARENGFTIYAIEGISSGDEPSSKKVANIVKAIKSQGVKAIFPESIQNPKVLEEITKETGASLGGQLLSDGLGETPETGTYEGMMKHNVSTIVDALK
jgi:ABC-type Zn uptake system ZnuABC Zn-binding protein ZnuA